MENIGRKSTKKPKNHNTVIHNTKPPKHQTTEFNKTKSTKSTKSNHLRHSHGKNPENSVILKILILTD